MLPDGLAAIGRLACGRPVKMGRDKRAEVRSEKIARRIEIGERVDRIARLCRDQQIAKPVARIRSARLA